MTPRTLLRETPQFSIIEVTWGDAISHDEWLKPRHVMGKAKPCVTRTVGFYVGMDNGTVALSCTHNARNDMGGTYVIPLGMVESVSVLRRAKP